MFTVMHSLLKKPNLMQLIPLFGGGESCGENSGYILQNMLEEVDYLHPCYSGVRPGCGMKTTLPLLVDGIWRDWDH